MRLRPVLLALGALLAAGGVALFAVSTPLEDLRAPALACGLLLLGLGAFAGEARLPAPLGAPGALLVASLLVSLGVAAGDGVKFLRQVRAQARMSLDGRRDFALAELANLKSGEVARLQQALPADARVLVLFQGRRSLYPAQLLAYYLRPRPVYYWKRAPARGRAEMPEEAWLRSRGIRWIVRLRGGLEQRFEVRRLEEGPRP